LKSVQNGKPLIFNVRENLSICGYAGITTPEKFANLGFDAQLQCVNGFEDWLKDYVDVKCLPFDDCAVIPQKVFISAQNFLSKHYDRGSGILISCAAGESRSILYGNRSSVFERGFGFFRCLQGGLFKGSNRLSPPKYLSLFSQSLWYSNRSRWAQIDLCARCYSAAFSLVGQ